MNENRFQFESKEEKDGQSEIVDWFSSIDTNLDRLYNPRLRTAEAQTAWTEAPKFLDDNAELLKFTMGSKEISVHLHGSMLIGVGNDGIVNTETGKVELQPSDIDLFVLVGDKDEYDADYQNKYAKLDSELSPSFKEDERMWRFINGSHMREKMKRRGDMIIVHIDQLISEFDILCQQLTQNKPYSLNAFWTCYNIAMLFGSKSIYETDNSVEARFRNEVITKILTTEGGKPLWNEIRRIFSEKIVNYELSDTSSSDHEKRVNIAFEEVLRIRGLPEEHYERAKDYMRKLRTEIQLPTYEELNTIRDKVKAT